MSNFKYHIKDKEIKIYSETKNSRGIIREYIHPEHSTIKAYIRQLSNQERYINAAEVDGSEIEVVINKRDVAPDMNIEFKDKHYQIGPLDNFLFYNTEVKFRAKEVTPRKCIETLFKEWNL